MTHRLLGSSIDSACLLNPTGVGVGVGVGVAVFVGVGVLEAATREPALSASVATSAATANRATRPETVHHVDARRNNGVLGRLGEKLTCLFWLIRRCGLAVLGRCARCEIECFSISRDFIFVIKNPQGHRDKWVK